MNRLFISVDLSIAVVERLTRLQDEIVTRLGGHEDLALRRVDPANIHVTLKFLGEVHDDLINEIEMRLDRLVKPLFPFEVHCRGLGAFPSTENARIVWAGLDEKGAEVMELLRQAIQQDLDALGFEAESRPYKPHVTLGRIRGSAEPDLTELYKGLDDLDFGSSYIRDLVLNASSLHADGPRYTVLNRFNLGEH